MKVLTVDDIRSGDYGGVPPGQWWTKWICHILSKMTGLKVLTFHWFVFLSRSEKFNKYWRITESTNKGTSINLCNYPVVYVYRVYGGYDRPVGASSLKEEILDIHAEYGDLPYDWKTTAFRTAFWWILKHYLGVIIRVIHDKPVNCQEWCCLIAAELGVKLIPDDEYPICVNLEHSPHLELVGILKNK